MTPNLAATSTAARLRDGHRPDAGGAPRRRDRARRGDMVELRLDTVSDPDVAGALAGRRQPVIVTCRAAWEGGHFRGSEEERHSLLRQALDLGAEYVDVEWRAHFDDLLDGANARRVVLSSHDFDAMPADLSDRARAMRGTGAAVIKIAGHATRLSDCLPLLEVGRDGGAVSDRDGRGGPRDARAGRAVRLRVDLRRRGEGRGQLSTQSLIDDFRFRSIKPSTEIYGLVGSPIAHSVSPAMHNAAFAQLDRDAVYLPLPATDRGRLRGVRARDGREGRERHDSFQGSAARRRGRRRRARRGIGALNTIRMTGDAGSDATPTRRGFCKPLDDLGVSLQGRRAAVLGAGGSARAVAVALASRGAVTRARARSRSAPSAVAGARRSSGRARGRHRPAAGICS